MARNKLSDLNDHLFAELERLNNEELTPEQVEMEAKRAGAIVGVSREIINTAKISIDALKLVSAGNLTFGDLPENLGIKQIDQR